MTTLPPPHTHAIHQRMKGEPAVLFHQSSVALRRKKCRISRHANNWILAGCPDWQFNPYGVLEDSRKPFIKAQHQAGFWEIAQQDGWEERGRGFGLIRRGASYMVTLRLLRWQCLLSSVYPCCPRVPTRSWRCTLLGFVYLFLSVAQAGLEFPSLLLLLLGSWVLTATPRSTSSCQQTPLGIESSRKMTGADARLSCTRQPSALWNGIDLHCHSEGERKTLLT